MALALLATSFLLSAFLHLLLGLLEFISRQPQRLGRSPGCLLTQDKAKLRHQRVPAKIHVWLVFIGWLMITMVHKIFCLRLAPSGVVALILHPLIDRKRRNAHPSEAEMIRTIVVSSFRPRVRPNCQIKLLCRLFHHRIETG